MFFETNFVSIFHDFVTLSPLTELSVVLLFIVIVTGLLKILKQPLIIGYLIAGIIVGPSVLNVVYHQETLDIFSHMGIGLLLFMVGLGLSPQAFKDHGTVALKVGGLQIILTALLGYVISLAFGFSVVVSLYIAAAVTFSSTIVIVKLLGDQRDEDSIFGNISIGMLIVQDIVAMLVLIAISVSMGGGGGDVGWMLIKGLVLLLWLYFFTRYVLPGLMDGIAKCQELLLLFGLVWCFFLGSLFDYVGLSMEIGALLAGMSFALSPYRLEMAHRLSSLRDFFLVLFFVLIGMQLVFADLMGQWGFIITLTILIVLVKPIIVYVVTKSLGYTREISLQAGLTMGQISEFSLLLISLGVAYGHISDHSLISVMMFVGLISICLSTYGMTYSKKIFILVHRLFWQKDLGFDADVGGGINTDAVLHQMIIFGYGRMGARLGDVLKGNDVSFAVVDHDPLVIRDLKSHGVDYIFADVSNEEAYRPLLQGSVKMCVSTLRLYDDNLTLLKLIKREKKDIIVVVVSHNTREALSLYDAGADFVLMPHYLSAHHASSLIEEIGFDSEKFIIKKTEHIEFLLENIHDPHSHIVPH